MFRVSPKWSRRIAAVLLSTWLVGAFPVLARSKRKPRASRNAADSGIPTTWRKLSVRDKVAQLVMVPFSGQMLARRSRTWKDLAALVKRQRVGGLILVNVFEGHLVQRADPVEAAKVIDKLQGMARIPLLVGADLERGASMRFKDTTIFPHAMAFAAGGDPAAARYEGEVTAREARAIGVNWVFFPDADVNSNPDNPIINIRSFSESPAQVSTYVDAFLDGAASNPRYRVLTTAKHFPGHGDTAVDTHLNMATVSADRKHLDEVELAPFRSAIAHGVDSIMTAHLAVPALGTGDLPATLSPAVLTTLLRNDLQFRGLIVTDALDMGGIAKGFSPGDAAVRAIEAGADVLLMPSDPIAAINAVAAAVKGGRISEQRLDQSVERVLRAKMRVGLNGGRMVDAKAVLRLVNQPESNARAMDIAQRAVTLVKNQGSLAPIRSSSQVCFAILRESATTQEGAAMLPEINKRAPGRPVLMLDPAMTPASLDPLVASAGACDAWYVAAFISVAGYRGNVALTGSYPALMDKLLGSGKPVLLISLGNPYILRNFPNVAGYMATFSTTPPSEVAAVQALYGETAIHGHLPVTIPNLAKFGDGIDLAASASASTR